MSLSFTRFVHFGLGPSGPVMEEHVSAHETHCSAYDSTVRSSTEHDSGSFRGDGRLHASVRRSIHEKKASFVPSIAFKASVHDDRSNSSITHGGGPSTPLLVSRLRVLSGQRAYILAMDSSSTLLQIEIEGKLR